MFSHKFLLLLILLPIATAKQCCPGNSTIERNKGGHLCSDQVSHLDINCTSGYFILDSGEDEYSYDEARNILYLPGEVELTEGFCLSKTSNSGVIDVAAVCFDEDAESSLIRLWVVIIMSISTVFLCLTLVAYLSIPTLQDLPGKCMVALTVTLLLFYISVIVIHTQGIVHVDMCTFQGFFMYYWSMALFFWLNALTFNVWRTVMFRVDPSNENKWFLIYFVWGFGTPLLLLLISIIAEYIPGEHLRPKIGSVKCWFEGPLETWAFFYGPASVLLSLNIMMFVSTSFVLWRDYPTIANGSKVKQLRFKFLLYFKLFLTMGIPWIFEVISFIAKDWPYLHFLWSLTDFLNCSQGVIIFLLFVVFRKRARQGLAKNKVFGINWPKSWADGTDEETDDMLIAEEVELNHVQKSGQDVETTFRKR